MSLLEHLKTSLSHGLGFRSLLEHLKMSLSHMTKRFCRLFAKQFSAQWRSLGLLQGGDHQLGRCASQPLSRMLGGCMGSVGSVETDAN